MKTLRLCSATVLAVLALYATGCSSKHGPAADDGDSSGISPVSPGLTYANTWSELSLDANSAKTTVDTLGHLHTDRNMCARPGDAVLDAASWNSMAASLNSAAAATPLTTERCWESPSGSKFFSAGVAELVLKPQDPGPTSSARTTPPSPVPGQRLKLFEYKNGEICTTIADPAAASTIMAGIESTLLGADRADALECPNYRP